MTATARVALSAAMLVKDWYLDIDTAYPSTAAWVPVSGLMSFKPVTDDTVKDATTFDAGGAMSSQKTADQWSLEFKLKRAPRVGALTSYDVGQEKLRSVALLYGASNLAHVRWYEANPAGYPVTESWEGVGCVSWGEDADGYDDIRGIAVKIIGSGARTVVSPNPAS
jgi:hypothetical protein